MTNRLSGKPILYPTRTCIFHFKMTQKIRGSKRSQGSRHSWKISNLSCPRLDWLYSWLESISHIRQSTGIPCSNPCMNTKNIRSISWYIWYDYYFSNVHPRKKHVTTIFLHLQVSTNLYDDRVLGWLSWLSFWATSFSATMERSDSCLQLTTRSMTLSPILYQFDRKFSHASQRPVNWAPDTIRNGSQASMNMTA
jgi:hypothetical protein